MPSYIDHHRKLQIALALYWRMERSLNVFGMEVSTYGNKKSDFMAGNSDFIVECEVKTNHQDLIRDLRRKEEAHKKYKNKEPLTPNYYYFAGEHHLYDSMRDAIQRVNPMYGIILINLDAEEVKEKVIVKKRASKLTDAVSEQLYQNILLRQSSMLYNYMAEELNTVKL